MNFIYKLIDLTYFILMKKKKKLIKKENQFLINAFFICGFISLAILLLIRPALPHKSSQDIATTISGILGTALGFFGSILVYKALIEQVKANRLIQKQFELQQFESRLYKMLDIYNLNVNNLKLFGRKTGNLFEGKTVFSHMISNFNKLKREISEFNSAKNYSNDQIINVNYSASINELNVNINQWLVLELSYIVFFYGVGATGRKNIKSLLSEKYNQEYLKQLLNYLSNKPVEYNSSDEIKEHWKNLMLKFDTFTSPNNGFFDKFYNGHQSNLGHYYRHLFMIIKFINEQKKLTYLEKWEYSKLLRTQLSNHEQELFFLNSISILGREWELNHIVNENKEEENKRFITKYDLIKNVSKAIREKHFIELFYPNVEFEDNPGETDYRKELENNVYN